MSSGAPLRTTRGTGTGGTEARWLATSRSTASARGTTNAVTVIRWCCCTARSPTAGASRAISMPWLAGSGSCCPERRGHGHPAAVPGPSTVEAMAHDTIAFVEKIIGGPVRLAGYSAGAVVALWAAVRRPDLVDRLALISGAFQPNGMILRPTPDAAPPAALLAAYAEVSPDGAEHFPVVIATVARSASEDPGLAPGELNTVTCPVLVVTADDDIVTMEHTLELYRNLREGQLALLPGTSHLLR